MEYHFKVFKEKTCYWADCIELQGCHSQGKTLKELKENLYEALNLYLDEPSEFRLIFPLPANNIKKKDVIRVKVEPSIAFAVELKFLRAKHKYTQKKVASLLGMKNIYSYQRLEKKGDPKLSTLLKIKEVFPEFKLDGLIF